MAQLVRPVVVLAFAAIVCAAAHAQDSNVVVRMAMNEKAAHDHKSEFSYLSEEKSLRTGGHIWTERVVETDDGPLKRLLKIDGRPLNAQEQAAEDRRIAAIVADPTAFRKEYEQRKNDEMRSSQLVSFLPRAFILTYTGKVDGCTQFSFKPNPAFHPSGIEERILYAMTGTVSLMEPEDRLCALEAHIDQPVEIGFGILGRINSGGFFKVERRKVDADNWKTMRIGMHLDGKIMLMKSITREQDVNRSDVREIQQHIPLAQAAELTRQ